MIRALKQDEVVVQAQELLSLMRTGWGLAKSPITGKYWAQKGGCGLGGPSKNVHHQVMEYLLHREDVKPIEVLPGQRQDYELIREK